MTPRVTIVDYGVGNLFSVFSALEYCGAELSVATSPEAIGKADRLLLPGVGAFGNSMTDMRDKGLVEPVVEFAGTGRPIIGICLGMQMLLSTSDEFGRHEGLDLVPGKVIAILPTGSDGRPHCIPHVGWSGLFPRDGETWAGTILAGTPKGAEFYFVHSFHALPDDDNHRVGICDYHGRPVAGVIQRENVIGCQFHPEKSAEAGLVILRNFLKL